MCSSGGGGGGGGSGYTGKNRSRKPKTASFSFRNEDFEESLKTYTRSERDMGNTWSMEMARTGTNDRKPGENWQQHHDRVKAERKAFETSSAFRREEDGAVYQRRTTAEKDAHIAAWIEAHPDLDPKTGKAFTNGDGYAPAAGTPGAPGQSPAAGVAPMAAAAVADRMAIRNKQKTAQRAGRASAGRSSLRIGA
jgi:hypothetical protein